ncbi:MAG: hypothetical protein ABSB40_08055 [Nitrososphaeria archaeon]|jgi:uncharacterized radical SAM superfamily protein
MIDGFIQLPSATWRRPTVEEVIEAAQAARKHLKNVQYIHSQTRPRGEVFKIYQV